MAVDVEAAEARQGGAIARALLETRASLSAVFKNPSLRRLQLALAGSMIGDWAYGTAVIVWAYGVGGAKAVGIWAGTRYILMSIVAPFAATFADRFQRKRVMITSDVTRCALVVAAGACIAAHTPSAPIYVLATIVAMFGSVFRPATAALTPSLVERPEELTASNGVASTVESVAFFAGPALGALLVAATNVQTVFYINAATFIWSAFLVLSIRPRVAEQGPEQDEEEHGALAMMVAGFAEIKRSRDLSIVLFFSCAQTIVAGAMTVYAVVMAVHILHTGSHGVGYINAVFGIGAIIGGFVALARASLNKLASDLAVGTFLWSMPLLLVVAWPNYATVMISAVVMGFGNPLVDVNFATAIQRLTPNRVLARVFGAFEGSLVATMAIGAAVAPFLIDSIGLRSTLALLALVVGVPVILLFPAVRGMDRRMSEPAGLPLLRDIAIFAPLTPSALDALARQLVRRPVTAGTVIVAEGAESDQFYLIESGAVQVTHGARVIRTEGPGEYFGEIGLLRDVPRTATVTAVEDSVVLTLARSVFLNAVSGSQESASVVEDVVAYRMRF